MTDRDSLLREIDARAAAAAASMTAAAGGESLCSISRDGRRIPGVKYPEGRWAALRELRRGVVADPSADLAGLVEGLRAQWADDLARRVAAGSGAWIDYRSGGVDAFAEMADLLSARSTEAPT